jgi:hypothetical protein
MEFHELIFHYLFIFKVAPFIVVGFFLIILGIFQSDLIKQILITVVGIIIVVGISFAIKKWYEAL